MEVREDRRKIAINFAQIENHNSGKKKIKECTWNVHLKGEKGRGTLC